MTPTISVVIPLYNKRPYIGRAVQSVLGQTLRDFELIVVDDGSTDGSAEELDRFRGDERLRIVRQTNAGEGAARNFGLQAMRSDLCALLDADDAFLPNHLRALMDLSARFPAAGLLGTAYYRVFPDGKQTLTAFRGTQSFMLPDYFEMSRLAGFPIVNASSAAVRRTVIERVGGFQTGVVIGSDLEYWARVALEFPVAYDPNPSALYYLWTPESAMANYKWSPDIPAVIGTVSRAPGAQAHRAGTCPAIDYGAWILLKHAACGIAAGKGRETRVLLRHPLVNQSSLKSHRALLWGATCAPEPLLNAYLRLRRWQASRSSRAGRTRLPAEHECAHP